MSNRPEAFWADFLARSAGVRESITAGRMRDAFGAVEALLQNHGYDFAFELTDEGSASVLVLTPEGDPAQAQRIDELLASRPDLPGWKVFGRRQRKRFADALTFIRHVYDRDASDVRFGVCASDTGHDVTVITSAVEGLSPDEAYGLAATLLDHSLGEDVVMSRVSGIHGTVPASQPEGPLLSPREFVVLFVGH